MMIPVLTSRGQLKKRSSPAPLNVMVIVTLSFSLTQEVQMHSKIRLVHVSTLVCIQAGQCIVILLGYLR